MNANIVALVPAAGTGTRLGDSLPKQYLDLNGRPMIFHALGALAAVARISRIVVVLSPDDRHWPDYGEFAAQIGPKLQVIQAGGATRGETVANGLAAIAADTASDSWAMVHDAARPCIHSELIEQFIDELEADTVGGLLALPLSDTIKAGDDLLRVEKTLSREGVWRAQTPQMFRYAMLRTALAACPEATDEAQAIETLGHRPKLVMGDSSNLKVTYAPDLQLARMLLTIAEKGNHS